jgi:hypothetical protein
VPRPAGIPVDDRLVWSSTAPVKPTRFTRKSGGRSASSTRTATQTEYATDLVFPSTKVLASLYRPFTMASAPSDAPILRFGLPPSRSIRWGTQQHSSIESKACACGTIVVPDQSL